MNAVAHAPVVLCYHRVLPHGAGPPWVELQRARGMVVRPETLHAQLSLALARLRPRSLSEIVLGLERGEDLRRSLCVTFDDGYHDFAELALPVLRALGVPSALFPVKSSAESGAAMPVERLYRMVAAAPSLSPELRHAWAFGEQRRKLLEAPPSEQERGFARLLEATGLEREPPPEPGLHLGAAALASLPGSVTLGGHGRRHHLLPSLDDASLDAELDETASWLRGLRGRPEDALCFAYPSGRHGAREEVAIARAGFRAGLRVSWAHGPWRVTSLPRRVMRDEVQEFERWLEEVTS